MCACVRVCDGLHQQLESGCSLSSSCGIQGQATGQIRRLSPAAGRIYLTYIYIYIFFFPRSSGLPFCPAREGSRLRPLALCLCECSERLSVVCVTGNVYMYMCSLYLCSV